MSLISMQTKISLLLLLFLYLSNVCNCIQVEDKSTLINSSNYWSIPNGMSILDDLAVESSVHSIVKDPRLYYFDPPFICKSKKAEQIAMASSAWRSRASNKMKIRQNGKIKSMFGHNQCITCPPHISINSPQAVEMRHCTKFHDNQVWTHTINGKIRQNQLCLEYSSSHKYIYVTLCRLDNENQHWFYNPRTSLLHHIETDKCLSLMGAKTGTELTMVDCCQNLRSPLIQWHIVNSKSFRKYK